MKEIKDYIKIYIDYSSDFAMINENITYSIFVENISDEDIENFFISINIPTNTEYCDESLICSEEYTISDKESGIILRRFKAKSTCNIFYKVDVVKVPEQGNIVNRNFIKYRDENNNLIELGSNTLYTKIKGALIKKEEGFIKNIIDGQLKIGETITFEIIIKNTGNLTAFDLLLTDIIPNNIEPLLDKVIINNKILALNSLKEISLGNLGPFKSLIIRYKAVIKNITINEDIFSICKLNYRYFNDFIEDYIDTESCSNELSLNVNEAIIDKKDFHCILDKREYFSDEEIYCKFSIRNSGNTMALNTVLDIHLADGISIREDYILVNGSNMKINSYNKILLGDIRPNSEAIVTFSIIGSSIDNKVKTISGRIVYDYNDLEIGSIVSKSAESNICEFSIYGVVINDNSKFIDKYIDKDICKIGDVVEQKVSIENKGNIKCCNLVFYEMDDYGKELALTSFKINGNRVNSNGNSIFIGDIYPGERKDIVYKNKIIDIPMDEVVRSRSYIEFNEGDKNFSKRKLWCEEKEIEVVGARIESYIECKDYYNFDDNNIKAKLLIRNIGNKEAKSLKLIFSENGHINIKEVNYKFKDIEYSYKGNIVGINSLNSLETIELDLHLEVTKEEIMNNIYLDGEIEYSFFINRDHNKIENERHIIEKKYLNIIYPDMEVKYSNYVKGIESNEEFSIDVIVKNTGNIDLANILIDDVLSEAMDLLYCSERVEDSTIKIKTLNIEEEKVITLVLKGKESFSHNTLTIGGFSTYEYFQDRLIKTKKKISPINLEFINSTIEITLTTEKDQFIVGEGTTNIITIKNKGTYEIKDSRLYLLLNDNDINLNESISINNKSCKLNLVDNYIDVGDIEPGETIIIKSELDSNKTTSFNIAGKLEGDFEFKWNREKRRKSFLSNKLNLIAHKVSLKSFISADKEIIYKGENITYSSVIINDGTVPINFSYKLNTSKSLEKIKNGFSVNGIIVNNMDEYSSTIEPSEGISIEDVYGYNNAFGGNKLFAETVIGYNYSIGESDTKYNKILKTDKIFTEAAFTTFKEVIVEHKEKLIDFEEELSSISNVYVDANILNYYSIDRFKNLGTNNEIISSTKVIVRGVIKLRIEYISRTNNVYIHNKNLDFISFIILPKEFSNDDKIELKVECTDIYYKIIDLSYLLLNINLVIKALF